MVAANNLKIMEVQYLDSPTSIVSNIILHQFLLPLSLIEPTQIHALLLDLSWLRVYLSG